MLRDMIEEKRTIGPPRKYIKQIKNYARVKELKETENRLKRIL